MARLLKYALLVVFLGFLAIVAMKVRSRHLMIWLPNYLTAKHDSSAPPTDVLFLLTDHYEPGPDTGIANDLEQRYPVLFDSIRDDDGRPPRRSWFYPEEQFRPEQMEILSHLAHQGYGEVELHLHHQNDNSAHLRATIEQAKEDFGRYGALKSIDGQYHFAFIHGNWSLDNGAILEGKNLCGVNDELTILREEGSFADFTFPAYGTASQPSLVNQIYYSYDDPQKPKSYNTGTPIAVGQHPADKAYMIFEGPMSVRWFRARLKFFPIVEYGAMDGDADNPLNIGRFQDWLKADVHVQGRPEWVFIKALTHGAHHSNIHDVLSPEAATFFRQVIAYAHAHNMRFHFVTAREAYNIVKAAEAGKTGNPYQYRDFEIPPYLNEVPAATANAQQP